MSSTPMSSMLGTNVISRILSRLSGRYCMSGNVWETRDTSYMSQFVHHTEEEPEIFQGIVQCEIANNPQAAVLEALKYVCVDPMSNFNSDQNVVFNGPHDTIAAAFSRAKTNPAPGMEFLQPNSLADSNIQEGREMTAIGHTQSGKTLAAWYQMYVMAVEHGLLPVILAMNRQSEPKRFSKDAEKFNALIESVLKILGISRNGVFFFTSVHEEEKDAMWRKQNTSNPSKLMYDDSILAWHEKKSIPVVVTIANGNRFNKLKDVVGIMAKAGYYYERYEMGNEEAHVKAFIVCDEADKLITCEDVNNLAFFGSEFDVMIQIITNGVRSARNIHFKSLYRAPSALLDMTATVQALAMVQRSTWRQVEDPIEMEPSRNYHGYIKYPHQSYNIINRVHSDTWVNMIGEMVKTPFTECAFVYTPLVSTQKSECLKVTGTFKDIFAVAWKESSIQTATKKKEYISLLRDKERVNEIVKGIMGLENVTRDQFVESDVSGVVIFETAPGSYVNSYPVLMELFVRLMDMSKKHKVVLFAGNMASRGTPIKALSHKMGLGFVYCDRVIHAETLIQVLGRLCGNSAPRNDGGGVKQLWAPEHVHAFHRLALEKTPVLRYLIQNKISVSGALTAVNMIVDTLGKDGHNLPELQERLEKLLDSDNVRAVFGGTMKGGMDSRTSVMKTSKNKRKAIDLSKDVKRLGVPAFRLDDSDVHDQEGRSRVGKKYRGSVSGLTNKVEDFVSEQVQLLKLVLSAVKRGGAGNFVDVGGVATEAFLKELVRMSRDESVKLVCKDGDKPQRANSKNYLEVKVVRASGTQNRQVMVKVNGSFTLASMKGVFRDSYKEPEPSVVAMGTSTNRGGTGSNLRDIFVSMVGTVYTSRARIIDRLLQSHESICAATVKKGWESKDEGSKNHDLRHYLNGARLDSWGVVSVTIDRVFMVKLK